MRAVGREGWRGAPWPDLAAPPPCVCARVSGLPAAAARDPQKREPKMKTQRELALLGLLLRARSTPRGWTGGSLAQLVTIRQVVGGVPLSVPGCQGWALEPRGGRACVFTAPCSHSPGLLGLVVPREMACSSVGTHSEGDGSGQVERLGYFNFPPIFPAKLVIITLIFQAKFLRPIPRRLGEVSPSITKRETDPGGEGNICYILSG